MSFTSRIVFGFLALGLVFQSSNPASAGDVPGCDARVIQKFQWIDLTAADVVGTCSIATDRAAITSPLSGMREIQFALPTGDHSIEIVVSRFRGNFWQGARYPAEGLKFSIDGRFGDLIADSALETRFLEETADTFGAVRSLYVKSVASGRMIVSVSTGQIGLVEVLVDGEPSQGVRFDLLDAVAE